MDYTKNFYQIKSNADIFYKISKEKDTVGYYNLPFQDTSSFKEYAKTVTQDDIVVIGIGGSSLGTYAIHKFLQHKENVSCYPTYKLQSYQNTRQACVDDWNSHNTK